MPLAFTVERATNVLAAALDAACDAPVWHCHACFSLRNDERSVSCNTCMRTWHSTCYATARLSPDHAEESLPQHVCAECRVSTWKCMVCGGPFADAQCAAAPDDNRLFKCNEFNCPSRCHRRCVKAEMQRRKTCFTTAPTSAAQPCDFQFTCSYHTCTTCRRVERVVKQPDDGLPASNPIPLLSCSACWRAVHYHPLCLPATYTVHTSSRFMLCDNHATSFAPPQPNRLRNSVKPTYSTHRRNGKFILESCSICGSPVDTGHSESLIVSVPRQVRPPVSIE